LENNIYYDLLSISSKSITLIQSIVYSCLIYCRLYKKYRSKLKLQVANIANNNLYWIKVAAFLFMGECLLVAIHLFGVYENQYMYVFTFMYLLFYGFYFFIHSILQPDISFIHEDIQLTNIQTTPNAINSDYNNKELKEFLHDFAKQKLYLQPALTLSDVSESCNIPGHKITELIKISDYKNFYDLVNQHRIKHCIALLKELPSNYSLDHLGFESGFKSRSSFYRVFKNYVGKTPSSFIAKQNNNFEAK